MSSEYRVVSSEQWLVRAKAVGGTGNGTPVTSKDSLRSLTTMRCGGDEIRDGDHAAIGSEPCTICSVIAALKRSISCCPFAFHRAKAVGGTGNGTPVISKEHAVPPAG